MQNFIIELENAIEVEKHTAHTEALNTFVVYCEHDKSESSFVPK